MHFEAFPCTERAAWERSVERPTFQMRAAVSNIQTTVPETVTRGQQRILTRSIQKSRFRVSKYCYNDKQFLKKQ
jgi:hypothetical protein